MRIDAYSISFFPSFRLGFSQMSAVGTWVERQVAIASVLAHFHTPASRCVVQSTLEVVFRGDAAPTDLLVS